MLLWYTKTSQSGTYSLMKSPSSYEIEWDDLDNDSYRSINKGNLKDTVVSYSWSKIKLTYQFLTVEEAKEILPLLQYNPIYIKAMNPIFGTDYVELKMRCSKKSFKMLETGDCSLSFNLVQKDMVAGQQ